MGVRVKSHVLLLKLDLSELWEMLLTPMGGARDQNRTLTVSGPLMVSPAGGGGAKDVIFTLVTPCQTGEPLMVISNRGPELSAM